MIDILFRPSAKTAFLGGTVDSREEALRLIDVFSRMLPVLWPEEAISEQCAPDTPDTQGEDP